MMKRSLSSGFVSLSTHSCLPWPWRADSNLAAVLPQWALGLNGMAVGGGRSAGPDPAEVTPISQASARESSAPPGLFTRVVFCELGASGSDCHPPAVGLQACGRVAR